MSTDYAEKEREFLTTLKADTGRDLDEWMAAIGAQSLNHRNDIIDWLRTQGFLFARASWLERIHNNGGRPIYWDGTAPDVQALATAQATPSAPKLDASAPQDVAEQSSTDIVSPPDPDFGNLNAVLAKAKAYRPLAQFLIEKIHSALPQTRFEAHAAHISIKQEREYAILQPGARDVRLGLDLGKRPFDASVVKARFTGPGLRVSSAITHMVVLDDARSINNEIMALIKAAYSRNSG